MIPALAIPIILFSMFVTIPQVDAACTTNKIGNHVVHQLHRRAFRFQCAVGQEQLSQFQ